METLVTKTFDIEKMRDESSLEMQVHKPVLQVFGPVTQAGAMAVERPMMSMGRTISTPPLYIRGNRDTRQDYQH